MVLSAEVEISVEGFKKWFKEKIKKEMTVIRWGFLACNFKKIVQ